MIKPIRWLSLAHCYLYRDFFAIIIFLIFAVIPMGPIIANTRTHILGDLGDNIHYVYMTGWVAQSLLLHQSPFLDPRLNYPDQLLLPTNDAPFLSMVVVSPATWTLGPVFGYNVIIFISNFLSGYITYLWIRNITSSHASAIFAGLAFLLTPYRIIRSMGHLNMISTHVIPLFFWTLDHALVKETHPVQKIVNNNETAHCTEYHLWLLGCACCIMALSSQYILVICLATSFAYIVATILVQLHTIYHIHYVIRIMSSMCFGTLVGSLPYIITIGTGDLEPYHVGSTRIWSADPLNFLLPSKFHPLWGNIIHHLRPEPYTGEKTLYIGIVAAILALIALFRKPPSYKHRMLAWTITATVSAIFALGTDLYINNQPIQRNQPFCLPAFYLAHIPLLNIMRVWSRFGIVTIFFVALLASIGIMQLMNRMPRWKWHLYAIFTVALVIDLLPGRLPSSSLTPRPIDLWLAQQPNDFAVAFLPVDKPLVNDMAIFGSLFHGKQMPAYLHARHQSRSYQDFAEVAKDFPAPYAIEWLKRRKFHYLLVEKALYNGWRAPQWNTIEPVLKTSPNLHIVTEVDGFLVIMFKE